MRALTSLRQRLRHPEANAAIAAGDERNAPREIEEFVGHGANYGSPAPSPATAVTSEK